MAKLLRCFFLLLFIGVSGAAWAQTGAISGKVLDETKQPVIGAIIEVSQGGTVRGGAASDEDGNYVIKPLNPGTDYEVSVKYTGYQEMRLTKVQITADRTTYQNFNLKVNATEREVVNVVEYKVPLIKKDEPGISQTITGEQFQKMATRNTNDAVSLSGGTYQAKSGSAVSIGGARSNGTLYIVDGVQVNGASGTNFAPGAIDQISTMVSGLPAKFGDALGGVVSITTKGSSPTHRGSVGAEHSVDGYNHNLLFFNLSGPLVKRKADSFGNRKPLIGYALAAQYLYDSDNDPNFYKNYYVKSDKLNELRERPIVLSSSSTGIPDLRYATEFINASDLETRKRRINSQNQNIRGNANLDFQVSENANLRVGGNYSYSSGRNYSSSLALFAPDAIPVSTNYVGRGFIRYSQRLGKPASAMSGEDTKKSIISNAYYSVQADYQVDYNESQDKNHKKDPFLYNYVGKFDTKYSTLYAPMMDSINGKEIPVIGVQTYLMPNGVQFTRSEKNPNLANYTSQVYDILNKYTGEDPSSLTTIQQFRGMLNGDQPASVYNLYSNVGTGLSGYSYGTTEQFAFQVDASFDLHTKKTRHAIEFGLYYQQRSERGFGFGRGGGSSIWNAMRLLQNQHLLSLDLSNPTYIKNGKQYSSTDVENGTVIIGPNDTAIFNPRYDGASLSTFSKNLRSKLGLDPKGTDYLNIDGLDPSLFSLSMFSADELLNNGDRFVNYYGYDYTGNRINGQVNFNDWFTKKDANGNFVREVGAFRPNYMAGYIMDKFELPNNVLFNIGVRIERFDANTKMLKDPYSLYAVETVGTSKALNIINGSTPSNMGSNYVVYVADNAAAVPEVVGYRNGDDWYDPYGRPMADPSDIQRLYSDGRPPQPFLQRNNADGTRGLTMKDSSYNPNSSFTDYKPQVNPMPRLSFTFPIADQSMFYAHYDVVVQRPKSSGEIYATPFDYYFLSQNASSVTPNPALKPEKKFDYELGFQQALNTYSAVTISGRYTERKDMIQVRPYLYAWPTTYYTYGNRDFSTTKQFILKYDLRKIQHLSLLLTYTLSFAEGTGSSSNGSSALLQNLIGAQIPNMRFSVPLNVDSRHGINLNLDYRYERGEGPVVADKHIFENMGLNFTFRARSGEPYTKYLNVVSNTIQGGVQQSRIPWHYMLDARLEKQFDIYFGKKAAEGSAPKKPLGLMAFMYVTNILNTRDVLGVYPYTGRPDDNGYLTSPQGQQVANNQINPQGYIDLYTISNQNSGFINNPRRINLGIQLNF
jgi:hypothetical protein